MERVRFQMQLYSITLTAISLVFGYVIVNQNYDALLLLPFITIMLTYRWIWAVKMVDVAREYLLQIEEKTIPRLLKSSEGEKSKDYLNWLVGKVIMNIGVRTNQKIGLFQRFFFSESQQQFQSFTTFGFSTILYSTLCFLTLKISRCCFNSLI